MSRGGGRAVRPARWAGVGAAAVSIALAAGQALFSSGASRRVPAAAEILAPLARAPLPPGSGVVLVLPPSLEREATLAVLYEAAWQRPDLRWTLEAGVDRALFAVTVGRAPAPAGSVELWRGGDLVLYGRGRR